MVSCSPQPHSGILWKSFVSVHYMRDASTQVTGVPNRLVTYIPRPGQKPHLGSISVWEAYIWKGSMVPPSLSLIWGCCASWCGADNPLSKKIPQNAPKQPTGHFVVPGTRITLQYGPSLSAALGSRVCMHGRSVEVPNETWNPGCMVGSNGMLLISPVCRTWWPERWLAKLQRLFWSMHADFVLATIS